MGLESVTYISDLVATNPVGATDPKSQGDDHIRNIKLALLNTFPNITGEVTATHAQISALAGGTLAAANGSNLTNLNASNIASGTLADGRLSDNVPLKDAPNTFTASFPILIQAGAPRIVSVAQNASENGKAWIFGASSGSGNDRYTIATAADDTPTTQANEALNIYRSGTTVTEVELNANALDFNGNADISGTLAVGGAATFSGTVTLSGVAGARVFDIVNADASQIWAMRALTNQLQIGARASTGSWSNPSAFVLTRSGDTITQVEVPVTLIAGSARIASEGGVIYHDSTNNLGGKIVLSSSAATTAGQVGAAGDMRFVYS